MNLAPPRAAPAPHGQKRRTRTSSSSCGSIDRSPRVETSLEASSALGRVSEAAGEIAVAEQELAAEVRLLHTDLVFLDEQIRLAESSVRLRRRIVDSRASQVESRLAGELGLARSGAVSIQVEGQPLLFRPPEFDVADLIGTALARRPELAVLSARCAQADVTLDLRKKERYPWFSLAQVSREFGGPGAPNTWGFRVGIDLPIFKWTRELMRGPEAEVEHCRAEVQAERSRISLEVEDLVEQLRAQSGELEYQHQAI